MTLTIEFTHGGPLDGEQLFTQWPPEPWYNVASGFYFLTRYHESTKRGSTNGTAWYRWEPDPADLRPQS